jgi:DNA polymerase phi
VAAAATSTKPSKSQDDESGDESEDLDLFAAESSAELEKYDEALANIIRLRKEKSSGAKELKQQSLNFKLRVLDLVEIYVRKQATNPLIWRCFRPMLEAIRVTPETDDKQALNARLVAAYGKLTKPKEYPKSGSLEDLNACIEELVAHVGKCSTSQLLSLLRDGLAALLRSLLHPSMHAGGNVSAAVDQTAAMLVRLLQQFTSRKSKTLNLVFFTQLCGRFPAIGWKMLPSTLECVASARTLFLSLEALSVAQEILRYASQTSELPAILSANAKAFAHAVSHVLSHAELAKRVKPKRAREVLRLLQEYCRLVAKSGSVADVFGAEADVQALIEALNKSLTIQAYEPSLKSVVPSLVAQLNAPR